MSVTASLHTRLMRLAAVVRGWLPWVLAWLCVSLACATVVGRVLFAQLDDVKTALAARLSTDSDLEVHIERLQGRFHRWNPVFELQGLRLLRGDLEVGRAGRVLLRVDLVESIAHWHVVASELWLEDLVLALEGTAGNGMGLRGGEAGGEADLEPLIHFLYHSDYVDLRAMRIELYEPAAPVAAAPYAGLDLAGVLVDQSPAHRGHLRATLSTATATAIEAELQVELHGYPMDPAHRAGHLVLDVSRADPGLLGALLGDRAPPLAGVIDRIRLRADVDPQRGTDFILQLSAGQLTLAPAEPVPVRDFLLDLNGHADRLGHGDVWVRELRTQVDGEPLVLDGAHLAWRDSRFYAVFDEFDIAPLHRLVAALDVIGERAERWLANLAPRAQFKNTRLAWEPAARMGVAAVDVEGLSLAAYQGVPSVRNLDFSTVIYEAGAWVDLATDAFFVHFSDMFEAGWPYDAAQGHINLYFTPELLRMHSDLIQLEGPQGRGMARLALYVPKQEADRRIALQYGLMGMDAAFTEPFLPIRLAPGLRAWLARAVRSGHIEQGGVVFNGAVVRARAQERALGFWLDVRDGRLAFDPAWPEATALRGQLLVAGDGVRGELVSGNLAGLKLGRTRLRVPRDGGGNRAELTGRGRSDGRAMLEFLRVAPLDDRLAFLDEGWDATGVVDFDYVMTVPLDGRELEHFDLNAEMLLDHARIGQASLDFTELSGRISYRHAQRLLAADTNALLLGGSTTQHLEGSFAPGSDGLLVEGSGMAEGQALVDWMNLDGLLRLGGRMPYTSRLLVRSGGGVDLRVKGPVRSAEGPGLSTGLPAPMEAPEAMMQVHMLAEPSGLTNLRLDWGELHAHYQLLDGAFKRGTLALGASLEKLPAAGLSVVGHAERLDISGWLETVDYWQQHGFLSDAEEGVLADDLSLNFELNVADAHWASQHFGSTKVTLSGSLTEMTLGFEADRVAGEILIGSAEAPLEVALEQLALPLDPARLMADPASAGEGHLEAGGTREEIAHLLANLESADLPEMNVMIRNFSDWDENFGSARFAVRPFQDGIRLLDIQAGGETLAFGPDAEDRAEVELTLRPKPSTRLAGRLSGTDVDLVFQTLGVAPSLDAETFVFDVDLAWEGGINAPLLTSLDGRLQVNLARGRFLEIAAGGGAMRMIGLLNIDAIARRIRLDFTDIYKRGTAFDKIGGEFAFAGSQLRTVGPLRITGPQSRFVLTGAMDMETQDLDGEVVVTLPVSRNLPWAAAYAAVIASPFTGAGMLVAERLFHDAIDKYSSARYQISGTVDQPEVIFDTIFESESAEKPGADGIADIVPEIPALEPVVEAATTAPVNSTDAPGMASEEP